ncbi:UNVERIFIED_CONTAM: hypothetical protein Sindi_1287600 [Sesamum indicum]
MPQWKIPMAQYRYLYTQTWTKEVDEIFCNYLYYHALCGRDHTDPWNPDYGSLCTAAQGIRYLTGRSWKLDFFRDRLNILRLRYDSFRHVLEEPSITWNRQSNRMTGGIAGWRSLIREQLEKIFNGSAVTPLPSSSMDIVPYDPSVSKPDVLFLGEKSRVEPDVIELVTSDDEI